MFTICCLKPQIPYKLQTHVTMFQVQAAGWCNTNLLFSRTKTHTRSLKKKTFCDGEGAMQTFGSDSSYCASTCINSVIISWRVFKQIDHPLTFGDTQIMAFFTLLKTCFCRFQCFVYLLEFLTVRLTCNELPDPKLSTAKNTNNIQRIRQMR